MLNDKISKIFEKGNYELYPAIPKNMLIELSNYCNSQCLFCANSKMTRKKGEINLTFLSNLMQQAYDLGVREVGFYTTGEPLIYKYIIDAIRYAYNIGYEYIYITTNGILADISLIKKMIDNGLSSIKFSINSINKDDYKFIHNVDKFDVVMKNLQDVYQYKKVYCEEFKVFVSYIATKYTDYNVDKIKKFFSMFCDEVVVVNVRNQSGMMPLETKLLMCKDEKNKVQSNRVIPCHYLFNTINVSYEGYLTACCTDFQNYLAYSDLNKEDLQNAWTNQVITKLRKEHLNCALSNNLCYNCIYGVSTVPTPLVEELATKIDHESLYSLDKYNERIKRKDDSNGNSGFVKSKKGINW